MKITGMRLEGLYTVDLPIDGVSSASRHILKAADGLGPPEGTVALSNGVYQGRDLPDRQITIRLGLNPIWANGETPEQLRTEVYGLMAPGVTDQIMVKLMNGAQVQAQARGYVSKIEIVPFSKEPEVQVVVDCDSPYLEAPNELTVNPSAKDVYSIMNAGTAPTGFYMEVTMTAAKTVWALYNQGLSSVPRMRWDYAFQIGDKLIFDTQENQKKVELVRAGVTSNIIHSLFSDSVWFKLHGGNNIFHTWDQTFNWGLVRYRPKYLGV